MGQGLNWNKEFKPFRLMRAGRRISFIPSLRLPMRFLHSFVEERGAKIAEIDGVRYYIGFEDMSDAANAVVENGLNEALSREFVNAREEYYVAMSTIYKEKGIRPPDVPWFGQGLPDPLRDICASSSKKRFVPIDGW